jgi:site-specific DNA recombinase
MPKQSKTVAFYLRVSTRHQDTPEGSIISQKQRLTEWFEYHNSQAEYDNDKEPYTSYIVYRDVETGTKAAKRPSYKKMLADIRMGKVQTIAAISISRLNRNLREFYELYDITQHKNVDIVSLKENFDTSTAIGRAILKFMLIFYELESEQTSERGKDNRYARAKRGLWVTATITGYKKDPEKPGQLIPIPSEVEVVNMIFDLYLEHGSLGIVRDRLTERGILTPARKMTGTNSGDPHPYVTVSISRILQNKVYIGVQQYQKGKRGIDGLPPGDAYEELPGNWEPIINDKKFKRVQLLLMKNRDMKSNNIRKKKKVFELSGLIKCGVCHDGPQFITGGGTSKTGKAYYYYKCSSCKKTIRADILEKKVLTVLDELGSSKKLVKKLIKEYHENYNYELDSCRSRLAELQSEEDKLFAQVKDETDKFVGLEGSGLELFKEQALKVHDELKIQLDKNQVLKDEIEQKIMEVEVTSFDGELIAEILKNLSKILPDLPIATKKAVLSQIIAGITVCKDSVEMRVGERIYSLYINEKASVNAGFTEANVERDRRDSNSRPPA